MNRRSLLAASAALSLPAAAQQPHPLRARLGNLRLGANLERWFPVAENNQPRRLGPTWWRQFRAAGFDHARLFIPNVQDSGEGEDLLRLFAEAAMDATNNGIPVLLGLTDSFHQSSPWGEREWRALEARAGYLAARTDPAMLVLAPLNEAAFPDAAAWAPMRDRLLALVRRHAPRHMLAWGGYEWSSLRSLATMPPPADRDTIAEIHDYQGGNTAAVGRRFAAATAWRDRHGIPVLVSELGGAQGHEENREAHAADLAQSLPALRQLRLPATLWAYTHGSWWRLQDGASATPRQPIRDLLG